MFPETFWDMNIIHVQMHTFSSPKLLSLNRDRILKESPSFEGFYIFFLTFSDFVFIVITIHLFYSGSKDPS